MSSNAADPMIARAGAEALFALTGGRLTAAERETA
jgi:hypothetical protein